jgi:hypothetical protein
MLAVHMFSGHHQTSTGSVRGTTIEKLCARKVQTKVMPLPRLKEVLAKIEEIHRPL